MFYIIGISIAFFLALLLLSKKNKTLPDIILFVWLMVQGIHLTLFLLRAYVSDNVNYTFLLGIEVPFPLLHGPFLFLYTAAMTGQLPANKKWMLVHFIPPLLSWLMFAGFYMLSPEEKIAVYRNQGAGFETQITINLIAIYLSGIFYVAWSILLLKRHRKNIEAEFSDTEQISLNWLRYLVYGIGLIWLVVLLGNDYWVFGSVVVFILLLGFFGIKQVGIFTRHHPVPEKMDDPVTAAVVQQPQSAVDVSGKTVISTSFNGESTATISEKSFIPGPTAAEQEEMAVKKKYARSGLTEAEAGRIHAELNKLMVTRKLYTEPELTLSDLATHLDIPPNYLSQIINEREEKNFYDYINTLRIEEFKRLVSLPENKKFTILSLAFECGFNSKSSFNRYFKKVTGLPPSEYMNT
jgi:AraC-like DNA-binding protein